MTLWPKTLNWMSSKRRWERGTEAQLQYLRLQSSRACSPCSKHNHHHTFYLRSSAKYVRFKIGKQNWELFIVYCFIVYWSLSLSLRLKWLIMLSLPSVGTLPSSLRNKWSCIQDTVLAEIEKKKLATEVLFQIELPGRDLQKITKSWQTMSKEINTEINTSYYYSVILTVVFKPGIVV